MTGPGSSPSSSPTGPAPGTAAVVAPAGPSTAGAARTVPTRQRWLRRLRRFEAMGRLPGWLVRTSLRGLAQWRSSLQTRVVVLTTGLSLVVVVAVGTFLLEGIGDGLVEERQRLSFADAARGAATAQAQFDGSTATSSAAVEQLAGDVVSSLEGTGADRVRGVLLLRAPVSGTAAEETGDTEAQTPVRDILSDGLSASMVPEDLREEVVSSGVQQGQLVQLPGGEAPSFVVGSTITLPMAGEYELYFVYSLLPEQQTIDLVRTTFVGGAIALVLLIGAVAWVVARTVVGPVRAAAGTAERLASGRLDERMRVRGTDDLARLGSAFNAMAAAMQDHIERLEELSRLQRRFVSDVSHELRTPLTTIRMAGEVLYDARADFDPLPSRSAELLLTQLERFDVLLQDLLEISRFDAGAAALEADPTDMRVLVHRVVEHTAELAERRGSSVRVVEPGSPCTAEVDSRRIERVLRNLLGNAVEHGEARPIEITVVGDEHAVAVGVRDHGVGLSATHRPRVFDRFWRADPARARTTGGSGLGLAIALEDTRLHGGWLEVWGHPGAGCHFVLTVPRTAGTVLTDSPLPVVPLGWREPVAALTAGPSAAPQPGPDAAGGVRQP